MATLKNRADLLTEAATNLPDNTTQEISPQDVREMAENLAESNFNRVTDSAIVGLKNYDTGVVYENGQGVIYSGDIYISNKTTSPGAFNPSDWNLYGSAGSVDSGVLTTTGIVSGGLISINADNTKFDLAAGKAVFVDNTDLTAVSVSEVSWTAQTALTVTNLATEARTNVGLSLNNDALPNVVFTNSFTATVNGASQTVYIAEKSVNNFDSEERRDIPNFGRLVHTAGTIITNAVNLQQHVNSVLSSFLDFVNLFPSKNVEGNEFSGKVGTLGVAKTAGKGFRFGSNYDTNTNDPNNQDIPAADPTTHFYRYQDGAGGFTQSAIGAVLDPANYDNGTGTLASVSPNRWTLQPVWVFAGSGTMFVQYGQAEYSTKETAIAALPTIAPVLDENLVSDAVFRGYFIIKQGATDLSQSTQFEWRAPLGEVGGGQGAGVVVDLQQAFNASFDPEIVTDSTRGALTIRRGSAADTDNVLEVQNGAGTVTFSVTGNGLITGDGSALTGISADNMATADLTFTVDRTHNLNGNTLTIRDNASDNDEVFKLGELFTGAATNAFLGAQLDLGTDLISLYSATSTNSGGVQGGLGLASDNSTRLWGKSNISLGVGSQTLGVGTEIYINNSAQRVLFRTGGTTFVNLDANSDMYFLPSLGNGVGIGTFSPVAKLTVDGDVILNGTAKVGAEDVLSEGRTAVKGANTLGGVNDVAFELYDGDTTPSKIFEVRNNGDIYTKGNQGFTGTGSYTTLTIENGIITNAV